MSCRTTVVQIYPPCPPACPETLELTFQNANLAGEGVFFEKVDNTVSFYGVQNTDGTIEVTLDATNKAINLDLNPELLAGNFPDATTTSKGKVELAIDGEAQAKTATDVVLTPSNLAALGATTSFAGFVELATEAETVAFASSTLAVTPINLGIAIGNVVKMDTANSTADDFSINLLGSTFQMFDGAANMTFNISGLRLTAVPLDLAAGGDINFNGGKVKIAGVNIPTGSFLTISGSTAGTLEYVSGGTVFQFGTTNTMSGDTDLDLDSHILTVLGPGSISIGTNSKFSFDTGHIQVGGVDVPADSFIRTDSAAGVVTSELCALYFGPHSTTEDYTVASYIPNRGFDPSTVTLPDLAIIMATLISDLAAVKKPNMV